MKEVIISLLDEVTAFLPDGLTTSLPDRLTASLSIRCKQACRREGRGFVSNAKPHQTLNPPLWATIAHTPEDNPHKSPKRASSYLVYQADRSQQNRSSCRQNLQHQSQKSWSPQIQSHPGWSSPRRRATACVGARDASPDAHTQAPYPEHAIPQASQGRVGTPAPIVQTSS
jgi:hypothetical protein